jgi:hypothetical protein
LDPRFAGSNPAEDDGYLMAIKICSMTSFKVEVKPEEDHVKPLWIVCLFPEVCTRHLPNTKQEWLPLGHNICQFVKVSNS